MSWEIGLGKDWNSPNWNSHNEGICESKKNDAGENIDFEDNHIYDQQCCLPENATEFLIICRDSYGDGWDSMLGWGEPGGYLEINGNRYCEDFTDGSEFNATLPNDSGMISSVVTLLL